MSGISSLYSRVASALSGLRNAFFGQTRSRARLNVIASYDQSNELFKVSPLFPSSLLAPTRGRAAHGRIARASTRR